MADDSRLVDVASAVAEGSAVDWTRVEQSAEDDSQRAAMRELQVVAQIAGALRTPKDTPCSATPGPVAQFRVGEQWGHLRISEVIGEGSFGTVYRAWDTRLECDVALKVIKGSGVSRAFDLARALREARLLARVRHKNVARVYGADCHRERFGLWMELVPGRTLEQVVTAHGPMGMSEAVPIGIDLCHALAAVHGAGLLHRDIKAQNVLREDGGRIVLMDFGTGRHISGGVTDSLAGTPLYLAPELFLDAKPSIASDIYSLGVLLYHLVTDDYPVRGGTRRDVESAHAAGNRQPLRDARPDLSPAFIDVVERALARDPANRYQSAGAFGNALAGISGSTYASDVAARSKASRVSLVALAAVVVAGLLVGLGMFGGLVGRHNAAATSEVGTDRHSTTNLGVEVLPPAPSAYDVAASIYALRNGRDVRLSQGSRVSPGDRLFARIEASAPVFVYIINRDDAGQSFLLFPLPGLNPTNPIPTQQTNRLPGTSNGEQIYWQVSTAGGQEHFLIYVSPHRLVEFEQLLAALPRPEQGRVASSAPLSNSAMGVLRGVGGLVAAESSSSSSGTSDLAELQPLPDGNESAKGVWARRVTFVNPPE